MQYYRMIERWYGESGLYPWQLNRETMDVLFWYHFGRCEASYAKEYRVPLQK